MDGKQRASSKLSPGFVLLGGSVKEPNEEQAFILIDLLHLLALLV
jgi:hypothetical protein